MESSLQKYVDSEKKMEKCRAEIQKYCIKDRKFIARVARRKAHEQVLAG